MEIDYPKLRMEEEEEEMYHRSTENSAYNFRADFDYICVTESNHQSSFAKYGLLWIQFSQHHNLKIVNIYMY